MLQQHKKPNIFSAFILIGLKNANILMFQTCSTNFTHIFGVLNCLCLNSFFLPIFKANVVQMQNAVNNKLRRTIFFILIKKNMFQNFCQWCYF